jgi:epoxyqueuosine reductase QueG
MDDTLKRSIVDWLKGRVNAVGFAPLDRFDEAPDAHHPSRVCKDARTVIVFGRLMPRAVLTSPQYNLHLLHRSYHTLYPYLDQVGLDLSNFIEAKGQAAVQIAAFAPLVTSGIESWGIISLKHAAVAAGLGAFGRNEVVYHPEHASFLRFGAVVTAAELSGDPLIEEDPCPPECRACLEACPAGAFQDGAFQKQICTAHTIRHAIYPLALRDEEGLKNIQTIINTAGYNYWLKCDECLKVCPNNRAGIE